MAGHGSSSLAREVAELDRELERRKSGLKRLGAELVMVRARRQRALDQLGVDEHGKPLRLAPLVWALVGGLAALTAGYLAYVSGLLNLQYDHPDGETLIAMFCCLAALSLGGLTLIWSSRPGAGASARAVLRPLTWSLCILSFVALIVVVVLRSPFP